MNRYWVGGTGIANGVLTTNWSTSSGGAPGASAPTLTDSAIFDGNSGIGTVTINNFTCLDFNAANTSITTFVGGGGSYMQVWGGFSIKAGCTFNLNGYDLTFMSSSPGNTIITNGVVLIVSSMDFYGNNTPGGVWDLLSDLQVGNAANHFCSFTGSRGTFNSNNYTITTHGYFNPNGGEFYFGTSTINCYTYGNQGPGFSDSSSHGGTTHSSGIFNFYGNTLSSDGLFLYALYNANIDLSGATFNMYDRCTIETDLTTGIIVGTFRIQPGADIRCWQNDSGDTYPVISCTNFDGPATSGNHFILTSADPDDMPYSTFIIYSANAPTLAYGDVSWCIAQGNTPFYNPNGTDNGNNTDWSFTTPPTTDPTFNDITFSPFPGGDGSFGDNNFNDDWNLPGGDFLPGDGDFGTDNTCVDITGTIPDCTGLVEVGVVYSNTNPEPGIYDYIEVFECTDGSFSIKICGLIPGQIYVFGIYTRSGTGLINYYDYRKVYVNSRIKKKRYYYKVYDGTTLSYVTTWSTDVLSDPRFRTVINGGAGELMVKLGRTYNDYGEGEDVKLNNRVELWCQDRDNPQGVKIYTGFISAYSPTIDDEDQYLNVTLLGYATRFAVHTLVDQGSGQTTITYNSFEPAEIMRDIIDKYHDDGGTDVFYTNESIINTGTVASYQYINNTIQEAIDKVIELTPENWFWYIDANGIAFLQPANIAKPDHKLTIGKDISYLSSSKRLENLVNVLTIVGGGSPTPLFNVYTRPTSISQYGKWKKRLQDGRVTSNTTSDLMAKHVLDRQDSPEVRTVVRVTDNNGDNQLQGANIENFFPGDTIQVVNLPSAPILIIQSINYTPFYVELECATRLPEVAKDLTYLNRNLTTTNQTALPSTPLSRTV